MDQEATVEQEVVQFPVSMVRAFPQPEGRRGTRVNLGIDPPPSLSQLHPLLAPLVQLVVIIRVASKNPTLALRLVSSGD